MNKSFTVIMAFVIYGYSAIVFAINEIPNESGFSGYVLLGGGYTKASSNFVAGTSRRSYLTDPITESLYSAPNTKSSSSFSILGELKYTFASTRTQIFGGQVFTDYVRYDLVNLFGVRQEINSIGTIGLSYVFDGFATSVWQDPYVVNQERSATDRNQSGFRFDWERMFDSQFTFQYTQRNISIDDLSGKTQLNLPEQEAQLLNRNGELYELQLVYKWEIANRHLLAPELLYDKSDTQGAAMRTDRYGAKLTYSYTRIEKGMVLIASALYTNAKYDAVNPIYKTIRTDSRYGIGLNYLQFGIFGRSRPQWAAVTGIYYFTEDSNIAFYDSTIYGLNISLMYRF